MYISYEGMRNAGLSPEGTQLDMEAMMREGGGMPDARPSGAGGQ